MILKDIVRGRFNECPYTGNGDVVDLLHHFDNASGGCFLIKSWQQEMQRIRLFRYAVAPNSKGLIHFTREHVWI